jgi:repressor LexA
MLTKKQHQLLLFIRDRMQRDGVAPSFDEMKEALKLRSKSGIHRLIMALEERGFLRRLPHRARALEVLKIPEGGMGGVSGGLAVPSAVPAPAKFTPHVITGNFSGAMHGAAVKSHAPQESIDLPLYGKIAAGTPIEALRNPTEHVGVPGALLGAGDHYALTVDGDSMIDAGIHDGDTIIIKRCETADNHRLGARQQTLRNKNLRTGQSARPRQTRRPPAPLLKRRLHAQAKIISDIFSPTRFTPRPPSVRAKNLSEIIFALLVESSAPFSSEPAPHVVLALPVEDSLPFRRLPQIQLHTPAHPDPLARAIERRPRANPILRHPHRMRPAAR